MSNSDNATDAAQKPSEVVAAVVPSGRAGKRAELIEPVGGVGATEKLDDLAALPQLDSAVDAAVLGISPQAATPASVTLTESSSADVLRALLSEAATILTIYAEVAVPVPSYRGQPLSEHAPRELVERIHRAIGA